MSLAPGSEVAIQFIAAEFAKAGLTPASGGSFLQPVPLVEYLPDLKHTQLTLRRGATADRYAFLEDFVGFFPRGVEVQAPLVVAGCGMTAPQCHYDAYSCLAAR